MKFIKNSVYLILFSIVVSSCVDNIDFNQANDYEAQPKYIASLAYFKIPAIGFFDALGNELTTPITDESRLTVIEEDLVQDNLLEAFFEFEFTNPFDRDIVLRIDFLDDADAVTYSINPITIPANTSDQEHDETIVIANNPQFLNSRKVRATLELVTTTGTPINPSDLNEFEFKSAGTFTFKL